MIYNEQILSVSSINQTDESYRITTAVEVEDLCRSIKWTGLINPPILMEKDAQLVIICGFRRICACQTLGFKEIKAKILDPGTESAQCAMIAVADNIFQRQLNLIEQSRALHLLASSMEGSELQQSALNFGLPWQPTLIQKIKQLYFLPQPIQAFVISGAIGLKMALELGSVSIEAGIQLAEMFNDLKLNLNKQHEIYTFVTEIARREDFSIEAVLGDDFFKDTMENENLDRPRKGNLIRNYLKKRRYPNLAKAGNEFQQHVKKLKLGSHIKLTPPSDFEGSTYTLNLKFRDLAELEDRRNTLNHILKSKDLKVILKR